VLFHLWTLSVASAKVYSRNDQSFLSRYLAKYLSTTHGKPRRSARANNLCALNSEDADGYDTR